MIYKICKFCNKPNDGINLFRSSWICRDCSNNNRRKKQCVQCGCEVIELKKQYCLDCVKVRRHSSIKNSYSKHRKSRIEKVKEYNFQNRDGRLEYYSEYNKKRKKRKYKYKQRCKFVTFIRNSIHKILKSKGLRKDGKSYELVGYGVKELKNNLECKFKKGMSWDNYGEWHIDHIIPIAKFKKDTPINIINSLKNLQPLWAQENLTKNAKLKGLPFCLLYKNKKYLI